MNPTYSGGCACGAVRYEIDHAPIAQGHCQCRDCQRRSGTGHGSYLTFDNAGAARRSGAPRVWRIFGDAGTEKHHAFCPDCGAPVWLTFPAMPDLLVIHAGSLDDTSRFRPDAITYRVSAPDWDYQDDGLAAFERMP